MQLVVTSYLFQKVYVYYQFKNIRSHTHMACPTLKLGQKETFGLVGKVRKYQYWWLRLRELLKNYTTNAGTLWHYQYIYMLCPADINNEKGLMTLCLKISYLQSASPDMRNGLSCLFLVLYLPESCIFVSRLIHQLQCSVLSEFCLHYLLITGFTTYFYKKL